MRLSSILFTAIIVLGSISVSAQNNLKKWYVSGGVHAVNHLSVRGLFDGYFVTDNWSFVPPLSQLSVARTLNNSFAVDFQASLGEIDNKRLNVNNEFMITAGLGLRYRFANGYILKENSWFDPYLRLGGNYLKMPYNDLVFNGVVDAHGDALTNGAIAGDDHFAPSLGAGMNFWITPNLGLNIESQYFHVPSMESDYIDFFQTKLGVAYRFGANDCDEDGILDPDDECRCEAGIEECNGCPDTDEDTLCDKVDECPQEPGPVENNGCPWKDSDGDGWLDKDEECDFDPCKDGERTDAYYCEKGCKIMIEIPDPEKEEPEEPEVTYPVHLDVFFDFDKSTVKQTYQPDIDKAAEIINKEEGKFYVTGHTDSRGPDSYNQNLSEKRAQSVLKELVKRGVDESRLVARGKGESDPVCEEKTEACYKQNRRVTVEPVGETEVAE